MEKKDILKYLKDTSPAREGKTLDRNMCTIECVEHVMNLLSKPTLTQKSITEIRHYLDMIRLKYTSLSQKHAFFLCLLLDRCDSDNITFDDFAHELACSTITIWRCKNILDDLVLSGFIRETKNRYNSNGRVSYRVPVESLEAIHHDQQIEHRSKRINLSADELFGIIDELFQQRKDNELSFDNLHHELSYLIQENMKLAFSRKIDSYHLRKEELVLLAFFCHCCINENDDEIRFHDFEDIYDSKQEARRAKMLLERKEHALNSLNLVELNNDSAYYHGDCYHLTDHAKEQLLSELNINLSLQKDTTKNIILSGNITPKALFYNAEEKEQVVTLTGLLQADYFRSIQQRLTGSGMRQGFACLLYGAPGTGKTETVYQVARQTGRNILLVNISETKSMWFGESEKRIKEVFEKYKKICKSCELTPILLFNEADAVLGKRKESTVGAVDQTENTIQNIILQEMETLEGIMIATTNLTQNFDKAFERRFLYKIEFKKPGTEVRQAIWQSMIPALTEMECAELADDYDFSGGEIENIARKQSVESVLHGKEPSLEMLHRFCQTEKLVKIQSRKSIGFLSTN